MTSIEETEAASAAAAKHPEGRVRLGDIEAKIDSVEYHHPKVCPHMTAAFVRMDHGFVVVGKSAPAHPDNFDRELGQRLAYEDAIRQLWPLEGYALRERMAEQDAARWAAEGEAEQ